ncbi:MAG: polymer-forming cytoskeletal protein [Bacteroidetes bacterium]|nr:polymer-forming cytoskeletal protein [Bacteroidota bacterium]
MFSNNKTKDTGKSKTRTTGLTPGAGSNAFNSLVQGTSVEGDIRSKSDIRVDGKIKGSLNCESKVVIGPTGSVEGDVQCKQAVIEGNFDGTLQVSDLLTIKETAKVHGEIRYGKLVVQPGATLIGDVRLAGSVNVNVNKKQHNQASNQQHAGGKSTEAGKSTEKEAANR